MTLAAVTVSDLSKVYRLRQSPWERARRVLRRPSGVDRGEAHGDHWALRGVSFEVPRGQTVGLVGANGAGKSTLLKILANRLRPTAGRVLVNGKVEGILELGTGLQPTLTGRENARINALFMGLDPWRLEEQLERIVAFSELGEYIDQPLETYSSGMKARLAFSVLAALEPEILVLDEALATGDAGFADKCTQFVRRLCRSGCTAIVVSHDLHFLTSVCQRLIWIDRGQLRTDGDPERVATEYLESFGQLGSLEAERPRQLTFRLTSLEPQANAEYWLHAVCWFSPEGPRAPQGYRDGDGLVMTQGHFLGYDSVLREAVLASLHAGVTAETARAPWGAVRQLPDIPGPFRSLTVGSGALFTLPVPPSPLPVPTALRVIGINELGAPLELSVRVDDQWHQLGTLGTPQLARQFGQYQFASEAFSLAPIMERFLGAPRERGTSPGEARATA